MPTAWVDLAASDGTSLKAYVARPLETAKRGLLLFHEAFGVNAHIRDVAERFAAEGFLTIAPDVFHRTAPGFECAYSEFPKAVPHLEAITEAGLDADVLAAHTWLAGEGVANNTASIGYCLGGRVSFVANTGVPLKAAVSYYGGRMPSVIHRAPKLSAPMLFFWGGLDHHIPEEQRRAVVEGVRQANKTFVDVVFSNADHGFFCDARPSYHPPSAAQAWSLTLAFLKTYCSI